MKSQLTFMNDFENFGKIYKFFISDMDAEKAIMSFSPREMEIFDKLQYGTTIAEKILALALLAYKIEDTSGNSLASLVK